MPQKTEQEELMTRYLLGDLTPEEQSRVEVQMFSDNLFFEQLLALEDELIDSYVQGLLSPDQIVKFEEHLKSSPEKMTEVHFVKGLLGDISEMYSAGADKPVAHENPSVPIKQPFFAALNMATLWRQYSVAAFSLIFLTGACLLIWNLNLREKVGRLESKERELQQKLEQADARKQNMPPDGSSNAIVSLILSSAVINRSGGDYVSVYIPPEASQLLIQIEIDKNNYKSHIVSINDLSGQKVRSSELPSSEQPDPGKLVFLVPANLFVDDNYILDLKGKAENGNPVELGEYAFRVKR